MKKLVIYILLLVIQINVVAQEDAPFEGNIRMLVSANYDKQIADLEAMQNQLDVLQEIFEGVVKTNKQLIENIFLINKKKRNTAKDLMDSDKEATNLTGVKELMESLGGEYEVLMKIKGNKLAQIDLRENMLLIIDGDNEEIIMTYPTVNVAIKYTLEEYKQLMSAVTKEVKLISESDEMIAGYTCKKATIVSKMLNPFNDEEMIASVDQILFTDNINVPKAYCDIFGYPGFPMMTNTIMATVKVFSQVIEVENSSISDNAFIVPDNYEFISPEELPKRLNKGAKKGKAKRTYELGDTIPEDFWDF